MRGDIIAERWGDMFVLAIWQETEECFIVDDYHLKKNRSRFEGTRVAKDLTQIFGGVFIG